MKLATLCYIKKQHHMLMLHRNKREKDMHKGLWVGLGGKFEAGESPEQCVRREVLEESGLTLQALSLRGMITFPANAEVPEDWYVFLFAADVVEDSLLETCDEGTLAWIPLEELPALNMHAGDHLFLEWMKQYRFFTARMVYQGNVLIEHEMIPYA